MVLAHADEPGAVHAEGHFAVPEHLAGVLLIENKLGALIFGDEIVPPLCCPDVFRGVAVQVIGRVGSRFAVGKVEAEGDGPRDQAVPFAYAEGVAAVYDANGHMVFIGELKASIAEIFLGLDGGGVDSLGFQHGLAVENSGGAPGVVGQRQRFSVIDGGILTDQSPFHLGRVESVGQVDESAAVTQGIVGSDILRINLNDIRLVIGHDFGSQVIPIVSVAGAGNLDLHVGVNLVVCFD
ncbi:hypothetical protein SDC9_61513 [bioreactor metagenome]|uniref:Uncharacterized protein n=1 Tax=bioreactor metagenome TaxID=1076179 RepID=A0A644XGV1_9ZZZZ